MQHSWHNPWPLSKTPEPQGEAQGLQGEAQTLRPYSNSESWEATPQAGTVNGRFRTKATDNKTTEEIARRLSWSQPAYCGKFLFLLRPLLFRKRSSSPLNSIYIFVLCSTNDSQALFSPGVQFFPLHFQNNMLETACWVHVCAKFTFAYKELRQPVDALTMEAPSSKTSALF